MPAKTGNVAEAARSIADALEEAGIDYAIGGALAYSYYGIPRATNDIDLNVFPSAFAIPELVGALVHAGCELDQPRVVEQLSTGNDASARCLGWRVDIFAPSLPVHESARERRVSHPLQGRSAQFLSAEDLMVFKILYYRTIDIADLERLLLIQRDRLDLAYVRHWLERLLPKDDPRKNEFEAMLERAQRRPADGGVPF